MIRVRRNRSPRNGRISIERSRAVMSAGTRRTGAFAPVVAVCLLALTAAMLAQSGPVAAMFSADRQRAPSLARSFERTELPATGAAGVPLQIYLSAGDLARAFDTAAFRPDAAIVPTNN